jgi:hypothetical protein
MEKKRRESRTEQVRGRKVRNESRKASREESKQSGAGVKHLLEESPHASKKRRESTQRKRKTRRKVPFSIPESSSLASSLSDS